MSKERTSVRMQAQIQRMAEQGYSVRATTGFKSRGRYTLVYFEMAFTGNPLLPQFKI